MIVLAVPVLFMFVGALMYAFGSAKVAELGRIMFAAGSFAVAFGLWNASLHLMR